MRMKYVEGEYFDPLGLQVEAVYNDDTREIVDNYDYEPKTPLTPDDEFIKVSYTESGRTVSTEIQIIVTYVNDFNFGYVPKEDPEAPTEPEDPEKPDDSTDSTDSTDSAKPEDSGDGKTGGCGSIISAGIIGGSALAAAAVVFTRRKKRG